MGHVGDKTVRAELVRHVRHHQLGRLPNGSQAFLAVGQQRLLPNQRVELFIAKPGMVQATDGPAVAQVEDATTVRAGSTHGDAPHHQFASTRRLQVLRPFGNLEHHLELEGVHVALPDLGELARLVIGLGRIFQHQRLAVGHIAPAVPVLVDIAVHVEKRQGAGAVKQAHLGAKGRVVAVSRGLYRPLGNDGLVAARQPHLLAGVVAQRNRAPQRHLVGRIAANHRVLHRKVRQGHVRHRHALHHDAFLGQVGCELVVGYRQIGHLLGQTLQQVVFLPEKGQPARLVFLDDVNLDPVDQRKSATLEALVGCLGLGRVGRWIGLIPLLPEVGVAHKTDLGRALPLGQLEGAGSDRVLHDLVAVFLDDLTGHGPEHTRIGQRVNKTRAGLLQLELQRVPVQRAQALDFGVVIKPGAGRLCRSTQSGHADDLFLSEAAEHRALVLWIGDALKAVDVIGRRQFALLSTKRGVVVKVDALPDAYREGLEIGRHLRHALGDVGHQLGGPCQVVIGVKGVEDIGRQNARIQVGQLGRIEAGLRHAKRVAQHLLLRRRACLPR